MSSKQIKNIQATTEMKIEKSAKIESEENQNIKESDLKNFEENDNVSEEENEFVVDLGNCTPIKSSTAFQFDERGGKNLNQEFDDEDNYKRDLHFNVNMNHNLIGDIASNSKVNNEEQQETFFTLDKILDDEVESNDLQNHANNNFALDPKNDLNKFNNKELISGAYSRKIIEKANMNKNNELSIKNDSNISDDLSNNYWIKESNKEAEKEIPKEYPPLKKNNSGLSVENNPSSEAQKNNDISIINKMKNTADNISNSDPVITKQAPEINEYPANNIQNPNLQINPMNNSPIPINKISRVSNSDIETNLKFEKILNTNLDAKHQFRICIVGDSNVGKTSLLLRYCDNTYKSTMTNTIGVDFRVLMLKCNDVNIKLQIWDTAGQERFKSISVNYFKSANGFIFVYDIANRSTFDNLNQWFDIVSLHNKNSICNFVVGNKCDLDNRRQISIEEGRDFAFSKKFNFMETSAKSAKNVDMAFEIFTLKLMEFFNVDNGSESNIGDDDSSSYSIEDGKKFKIDESDNEEKKSKKRKGCKC